jgi:hypothetical protein
MNIRLKKTRIVLVSGLALLTVACVDQQSRELNAAAAHMSDCEIITALIAAHHNDFKKIRYSVQNANKIDIWKSRYHLVGNNCQIWSWGAGSSDYVCSLISPDEEIARKRFEKAKTITRQCLDDSWVMA